MVGTALFVAGAAGSLFDLVREPRLNHRVELTSGVREQECGAITQGWMTWMMK